MVHIRLLLDIWTVIVICSICLRSDLCLEHRFLSASIVERFAVAAQPVIETSMSFVPRWHHIHCIPRSDPSCTKGL